MKPKRRIQVSLIAYAMLQPMLLQPCAASNIPLQTACDIHRLVRAKAASRRAIAIIRRGASRELVILGVRLVSPGEKLTGLVQSRLLGLVGMVHANARVVHEREKLKRLFVESMNAYKVVTGPNLPEDLKNIAPSLALPSEVNVVLLESTYQWADGMQKTMVALTKPTESAMRVLERADYSCSRP